MTDELNDLDANELAKICSKIGKVLVEANLSPPHQFQVVEHVFTSMLIHGVKAEGRKQVLNVFVSNVIRDIDANADAEKVLNK